MCRSWRELSNAYFSIYLQNMTSIQPRTSPVKFAASRDKTRRWRPSRARSSAAGGRILRCGQVVGEISLHFRVTRKCLSRKICCSLYAFLEHTSRQLSPSCQRVGASQRDSAHPRYSKEKFRDFEALAAAGSARAQAGGDSCCIWPLAGRS